MLLKSLFLAYLLLRRMQKKENGTYGRRDWDYRRALPWYQNTFLTKNFQVAEVFAAYNILERFPFSSIDADLAKPPIQDSLLFMFGMSRVLFSDEFFQPAQLVSRRC